MNEPFDILKHLRESQRKGLAPNEFVIQDIRDVLKKSDRTAANCWIRSQIEKGNVTPTGEKVLIPDINGHHRPRPVYRWVGKGAQPVIQHRKLGKHRARGLCWPDGLIEIDERLRGKERLEILLHEIDHYLHPDKEEDQVASEAEKTASLLWGQNVRIIDSDT